jgi:hypothetical protein
MSTMKWEEIKQSIIDDLMSRGLKDPNIRIRALNNIEALMREHFPNWIANPDELKNVNKDKFKREIFYKKGKSLNGAENTVINEIYYRVIPDSKTSKTSQSMSNNLVLCPKCGMASLLPYELANEKYLKCLACGNDFKNPYKKNSPNNIRTWLGLIVLAIFVISLARTCYDNQDYHYSPDKFDAYATAKSFVEKELKAPRTAKFPMTSDIQIYQSANEWTIIGYVDSQNGFGALVRTQYKIEMSYDSDTDMWTRKSLSFFE